MLYGLSDESMRLIVDTIASFDEIEGAFIFGSRAMGNYKRGSDVDIAIKDENISGELIRDLSFILNEELPLTYIFDVLGYSLIESKDLIEQIDKYGVEIYSKV